MKETGWTDDATYLGFLSDVGEEDAEVLKDKFKHYGNSWKKRGGPGAYFVMIRKADRLEQSAARYGYDIFKAVEDDPREEGILDDIRDLRRYLMLIEAELRARGIVMRADEGSDTFMVTMEPNEKE